MNYYEQIRNALILPDYMKEHLARVQAELAQVKAQIESPVAFAFVTDPHIHQGSMSFVSMLRELARQGAVDRVFCGGDFPWAFGSREECLNDGYVSLMLLATLRDCMKVYPMRGNHDFTIRTSREDESGYTAPYEQIYPVFNAARSEGTQGPQDRLYYYVDDADRRVRFIALDTCKVESMPEDYRWGIRYGIDPEQLTWLAQEALCLPEGGAGWSVIAMGHIPWGSTLPSVSETLDELAALLQDFKNRRKGRYGDFTQAQAEFVAYLCGHNHKDADAVEDNTLLISTSSSSCLQDDRRVRTMGTVTEELFDVYVLDKANRQLIAVRAGAGESRVFHY